MDVVSRRLELLRLEAWGLSQPEIVKQLSVNAGCSKRTLYHDFEMRASWQLPLQSLLKPEDVLLKIINRYEQIYRQVSMRMLSSSNELVQLGALNIMLKVNSKQFEIAVMPEVLSRIKTLEDKVRNGVFVK